MSFPSISLIVNTYENPMALEKALGGLRGQSLKPMEVLIADDGSTPSTRDLIIRWQKDSDIPLHHCWQQNQGFRRAMILNQALARARGEYIVFLDGDCVPQAHFIADHARLAEGGFWVQGRRAFIKESFVPRFEPRRPAIWRLALAGGISGFPKGLRLPFGIVRRDRSQNGILGCNLGFWRKDLIAVNGYDEDFTGWGREDSDLANRVYHLGRFRKLVYGRAIIYHLNHPLVARTHLQDNQSRLDETIRTRKIRCIKGVDQYLAGDPQKAVLQK
jgi:glycosyltransferase involved in cell wall biosynthesis